MPAQSSNMSSKAQSGTTTYPTDNGRHYVFILAGVGGVTLTVGGGDALSIPEGGYYEPLVCPTSELVLTGACVVITDTAHP